MTNSNQFHVVLFTILFITLLIQVIKCESDQMRNAAKLRAKLLVEQKYDRLSKPVKNHTSKIELLLMIHLFQIVDLSSTGELKTNLLIMSAWADEHLVWNASEYNGLEQLRFGNYEIWKPDLVIWNYDKGDPWGTFDENDLIVESTGEVSWDALTHSVTYCRLDLSEYPFDTQNCVIKLGPWMYNAKDVNLTSPKMFEGPYYTNGEWLVKYKEAVVKNSKFTTVDLKFTLERRTTIYTYFIVLPYLLSVLFILSMMIGQISSHQQHFFAGCSIFIQLFLIMFIISHIGFFTAKAPRAVRCMSINILFTICTICLSTFLTIKNESMRSKKLPLFIDSLLDNETLGKIFVLDLQSIRVDSNLMPFVNEDENERTNDNSAIEIQAEETNEADNVLILEKGFSEGELFNLKRWFLFRTLIDRLVLYIYLVVLVTFHI